MRIPLPKTKIGLFSVNVIFIVAWYQFDYHIITIIYLELLNKISIFISPYDFWPTVFQIIILFFPMLHFTYYIWWGKNKSRSKLKQ